jgi:hypothetical protein
VGIGFYRGFGRGFCREFTKVLGEEGGISKKTRRFSIKEKYWSQLNFFKTTLE